MGPVAVILGSAFQDLRALFDPEPHRVHTAFGEAEVHRLRGARPAYAIFRHGRPHRLLPPQINYRANAAALKELACGALLVNSSVGVMDPQLPLNQPMLVSDVLWLENRLPDGSTCTIWPQPAQNQGHLVLNEGLFSSALAAQIERLAPGVRPFREGLVFAFAGGPRTKTPAENRALAQLGGQVNSMTLAPEVVLANELEIPCAGLVVGHKYSLPGEATPDTRAIGRSLEEAREATEAAILAFLERGEAVPFANAIHRF
ncbi:MAG: 5'-methylthioadenosine phosphorylase [Opitutales bacterium]